MIYHFVHESCDGAPQRPENETSKLEKKTKRERDRETSKIDGPIDQVK